MSYRIRYQQGPDNLSLGAQNLWRGEWADATLEQAQQAMLADRVKEFGFECEPALSDPEFEQGAVFEATPPATRKRK